MDILGIEVDPSFVFRVDPCMACDGYPIGYAYHFKMYFKDGSTYRAELTFNINVLKDGSALVADYHIDKKKLKGMQERGKAARNKISTLRNSLIEEMRNKNQPYAE